MPPFREGPIKVDRRLDGETLQELREVGHGCRINIVDASYPIPRGARVLKFPGTTAEAFEAVVRLIPIEGEAGPILEVTEMCWDKKFDHLKDENPKSDHIAFIASKAIQAAGGRLEDDSVGTVGNMGVLPPWHAHDNLVRREDEEELDGRGFYTIANDPDIQSIFIKTQDDLPFACVSLVVGHSQRTE